MASSRLPGKMLADLGGITTVELIVARARAAACVDDVVVATTNNPGDDELAAAAEAIGVKVFRGSEDDVLDRVTGAHRMMVTDIVVKLCGDCPLIDPAIIIRAVDRFRQNDCDIVTTTKPQSYPQGMDVEVFEFATLANIAATNLDPAVREHVTLAYYDEPDRWRIANLEAPDDLAMPDQRLQLDYEEDLAVLRAVHAALAPTLGDSYTLADIVEFLCAHKEVCAINRNCEEREAR